MEKTRTGLSIPTDVRASATPAPHSPRPAPRPADPTAPWPARPPQRYSVRAQVLDALRTALLDGTLEPGRVYSAPGLAERFGVSATPVREAMQQLACEGVVETVPNRGFRIAEHSARDVVELAEIRALLEVPTVLRLARTLPRERWRALRPSAEATVTHAAACDLVAYAEADRAFHRALLELAGNRQLVHTAEALHRRAQCALARTRPRRAADLLAEAGEHLTLLDHLERRDLAGAEQVLRAHLSVA